MMVPLTSKELTSVKSTLLCTTDELLMKRLCFWGENSWLLSVGMILKFVPSPLNGTPWMI